LLTSNSSINKKATGRKVTVLPTEELTVALNITREELLSDALLLKSQLKEQIVSIFKN
jgi:hypothetical protein